jgi:hypothetical protein
MRIASRQALAMTEHFTIHVIADGVVSYHNIDYQLIDSNNHSRNDVQKTFRHTLFLIKYFILSYL